MLSEKERQVCVDGLLESHRTKVQGRRPSEMFPEIEIEDSYAISSAVAAAMEKNGAKVVGHKIGLTSKAMQASSKIDEPDYGYIFDNLVLQDGAQVRFEDFCVPRVEPELTFILKEPLKGPGVGLVDVMRATEWVVPSIEIIDARVTEPRKIYDTVADNGAAAGLVLGGRRSGPRTWTCAGSGRPSIATARSRKRALPAGCWATRQWPSPGWPTSWRPSAPSLNPVT